LSNKSILIKRGTLIDPNSEFNRTTVDILIEDGKIKAISKTPISDKVDVQVTAEDCFVLPGMLDLRCQLKDPGYEHQEDISSGSNAAMFSGFTALAVQPTTLPVTQNKSQIENLKRQSEQGLIDLLPIGATTENLESRDITEMYDMRQAGAVGYSNGDNAYPTSGALMRALLYSKQFGGLIMSHALDPDLAKNASVNESDVTIHTGLKQQPDLAETSQIKKEIDIAAYAESHIHFSHISSGKSVEVIRAAKKEGLDVSCDVSIWHLIYTDESVLEYDTNYKVTPPFRSERDRLMLIEGVLDGTIDAIVTDHNPQNAENKVVEFDYADYGINGLQTFYSAYNQFLAKNISMEVFVNMTAHNPRMLLNQPEAKIAVGEIANIWVADPSKEWMYDKSSNLSKSENNPLFKQKLVGKCSFVMNNKTFKTF